MFSTYTTNKFGTSCTAFFYSHLNKLTNTILVKNLEWVYIKNLLVKVYWQETCNVITAISKCHLG